MAKKRAKTKNTITIFGKTIPNYAFVGGLVLITLIAFLGYNLIANELDRRKFVEIEKTVTILEERVNVAFGVNAAVVNTSCYKDSVKYETKTTYCSVSLTVVDEDINSVTDFIISQSDMVTTPYGNESQTFRLISPEVNCNTISDNTDTLEIDCVESARAAHYILTD